MSTEANHSSPAEKVIGDAVHEKEPDSRRYWRAAISHLIDPQKRDAAWEFYLRKLEGRKIGDTFSGLVLLLEANGVFLSSLPERIQLELMEPFAERFATIKAHLAQQEARQREILERLEKAAERNKDTNTRAIVAVATAEGALRKAATALDASSVVREVKSQIEEEALIPFKRVLKDLAAGSKSITEATRAAETAVARWRRVHLGGVAAGLLALSAVVVVGAIVWLHGQFKQDFEKRFTAAVMQLDTSREAFFQLAQRGIGVHMVRTRVDGKVVPDSYTIMVDGAENAYPEESQSGRRGIVIVKTSNILPPSGNKTSLFDPLSEW
jgi:hypothetical protein